MVYELVGGALVGLIGGQIEASQQRSALSGFKADYRKGVRMGEARTQKEVYDILNSPEYQVAREFTLGTYGVAAPSQAAGLDSPISFAGHTFVADPTGSPTKSGQANRASRQIDQYLNLQRQLDAGVNARGETMSDQERTRLQTQLDNLDINSIMAGVGTLDSGSQNELIRQLGKRGVSIDEFSALRQDLGIGAEPEMAEAMMPEVVESPLTRAFKQQIRQSATERGLYSSEAAAAAEASGLAAFQYQQQQAMLPQLMQLATFGSDIYHRYEGANLAREVSFATGGLGSYGQANQPYLEPSALAGGFSGLVQGALSGAALGQSYQNYNNSAAFNEFLRQQYSGFRTSPNGDMMLPENAMQPQYS